jgi:hypothetical protein
MSVPPEFDLVLFSNEKVLVFFSLIAAWEGMASALGPVRKPSLLVFVLLLQFAYKYDHAQRE